MSLRQQNILNGSGLSFTRTYCKKGFIDTYCGEISPDTLIKYRFSRYWYRLNKGEWFLEDKIMVSTLKARTILIFFAENSTAEEIWKTYFN